MSIPCNPADFSRFLKLATALSNVQPPVELKIWCLPKSNEPTYVSVEITGSLPPSVVYEAFGLPDASEALPEPRPVVVNEEDY